MDQSSLQTRIEEQFQRRVMGFIAYEMPATEFRGWDEARIMEHAKDLSELDQTFSGLGSDWPHDRAVAAYANHMRHCANLPTEVNIDLAAAETANTGWEYWESDAQEFERAMAQAARAGVSLNVTYHLTRKDNRKVLFFRSSDVLRDAAAYAEVDKGAHMLLEAIEANAILNERVQAIAAQARAAREAADGK